MATPARFPSGLSTAVKGSNLGNFGMPDPTQWHVFFDDFTRWVTDDSSVARYTITTIEAGAGSATETLNDELGGVLLLTNDNADNDSDFLQKIGESFVFTVGKAMLFKARFRVNDATQSDWVMGLMVVDSTPLADGGDGVTDGVFFQKDDGDTNIDFYVQKDITTGQLINTTIAFAPANNVYMTLGFWYDGNRTIRAYLNDALVKTVDLSDNPAAFLPDTELTVSFGIQNGEAVIKTMSIDYVFAALER